MLMASISVLPNRPAIMSHYGECDIDAKRAGKTSGPQQLAKRTNKHRQERNFKAWQRFSPDGTTCRFCKHDHTTHLCTSAQPHFYRPATEAERSDTTVMLYRHNTPGGGSILVRRMTVARHAEIVTAFCVACAPRYAA